MVPETKIYLFLEIPFSAFEIWHYILKTKKAKRFPSRLQYKKRSPYTFVLSYFGAVFPS